MIYTCSLSIFRPTALKPLYANDRKYHIPDQNTYLNSLLSLLAFYLIFSLGHVPGISNVTVLILSSEIQTGSALITFPSQRIAPPSTVSQVKTLKSSLMLLFFLFSDSSGRPVGSTFETDSESDHSSPCPGLQLHFYLCPERLRIALFTASLLPLDSS